MNEIHICSFASRISDLSKRQCKDKKQVLGVLKQDPMVSTWEMDDARKLYKMIDTLREEGLITDGEAGYPWHKFVVTEKGAQYLEAS